MKEKAIHGYNRTSTLPQVVEQQHSSTAVLYYVVRISCLVRRFRIDLASYLVWASIAEVSYVATYDFVGQFELHLLHLILYFS